MNYREMQFIHYMNQIFPNFICYIKKKKKGETDVYDMPLLTSIVLVASLFLSYSTLITALP